MLKKITDELETACAWCAQSLPASNFELSGPVLENLARAAGCNWAAYWRADARLGILSPVAQWSDGTLRAERLTVDTLNRTLTLGEGTAGHVWRSGKPVWTSNLVEDMCLPRSLDATAAGLHGGIWFAIKTAETVHGVIELLGAAVPRATEHELSAVERAGTLLGCVIDEATRSSSARAC